MGERHVKKIKLVEMYVDDVMKRTVLEVLESGNYVNGVNNRKFEEDFAKFCGVKRAVAVSSGTAALYLALSAVGVGRGDEVIVPAFSFIATASPVVQLGAKPVFVDINPKTYTIDIEETRKKISNKTKALVPVHLYGHPVDMNPLLDLAEEKNLFIVEDACQAHGAEYKGTKVGSLGDIGCFSFYPSKNMTVAGDGGMITTNNDEFVDRAEMIRNQGRKEKYTHELMGWNFRLSEIHAAIGRQQLKHLPDWTDKRREIARIYTEALSGLDLILPIEEEWAKHVYHVYVLRSKNRDRLAEHLNKKGIATVVHYPIPIHKQPCMLELGINETLRVSERCANEVISIPMHPHLSREDVEYVIMCLKEYENR